jgi:hydroxymethylglutaryl-CoA reductase (NADPH)
MSKPAAKLARSKKPRRTGVSLRADGAGPVAPGPESLAPRFRDRDYAAESLARRRQWLQSRTGSPANHIANISFDPEILRGNIENAIGVAQVPLGIAGPLMIQGERAHGTFYVPLATTEGALIRSYERGMVTLTHSGGAQALIAKDENHIAPVFEFPDVLTASRFTKWVEQHAAEIRTHAEATTRHGKLLAANCHLTGRQVMVELRFHTGDAQGMNLIVKAADAVCRWIAREQQARFLLFSGLCSEKRAGAGVLFRGKGKTAVAGALLPHRVLKQCLHVTAEELVHVWHATIAGQVRAGAVGLGAHAANGLAALFIATGQDVATLPHAACAITNFELDMNGVYASVTLPGLSIATVGGGTGLPTQREALELLGCYGADKARKFAEITAATVLAGEISMAAALASGDFAAAHERYGRNRPRRLR